MNGDFTATWDRIYQIASGLLTLGSLGILVSLSRKLGQWEEWKKSADKKLDVLDDVATAVSRIEGRFEGSKK